MKDSKKKVQKSNSWIFLLLICITTCFMGIGFASINIQLGITGEALAEAQTELFITDVRYVSDVNADLSNILEVMQSAIGVHVEFDSESLKPTYKLIIGIPGLSNAVSISANLGLSEDLVWEAKQLLITQRDPSALAVERLQDTQQRLDVNLKEAEALNAEAEELKQHYEKELSQHKKDKKRTLKGIKERFESQLDNAKDEIKEILNELRQEKSEKIARRSYARLAKLEQGFRDDLHSQEEKETYQELEWSSVKVNDKVMLKELNQEVTVLSLPDKSGNLFIQMGMIKTKVKKEKLAELLNNMGIECQFETNVRDEQINIKMYSDKNNILIEDITSSLTASTGFTINSNSKLYKQNNHVFGTIIVEKTVGYFSSTQETIANISNYAPLTNYFACPCFCTSIWNVQNVGYAFITRSDVADAGNITVSDIVTTNNYVKLAVDYIIP